MYDIFREWCSVIEFTHVQSNARAIGSDDNKFAGNLESHVMRIFGKSGWDDPVMDIYNDLDPRTDPYEAAPYQ